MADVDRRRTRTLGKQRLRQACHPVLSTSATSVWRASESFSSSKPEKARARVLAASASSAQPSCGALIVLLVCATASHENYYGPCETPIQNDAAMPFLEQNKTPWAG